MKARHIAQVLEEIAPLALQEDFDNSGFQTGNPDKEITSALLCLDVTEEVVDEAISSNCEMIISHHPLIFSGLKSVTGASYIERCVIKACKNDLVIYSAHTNVDNAWGGVSFKMAQKIGLTDIKVLSGQRNRLLKLSTFVPSKQADVVRQALWDAGAGHIGNYDACSFNVSGNGTFRAGEGTDPFCGKKGEIHTEPEVKIEVILPAYQKNAVLNALLSVHPYEEPAYDFFRSDNVWEKCGSGAIGHLPEPEEEVRFLERIKNIFSIPCIKHSPLTGKKIQTVALCGGSGAFLLPEARTRKADVFLSGDLKYHDFFSSDNRLLIADMGHYESEQFTKEIYYDVITKKFPNFAVRFSNVNTNPINYL